MDLETVKKYLKKVQDVSIDDIDNKELIDFVTLVIKDFDNKVDSKKGSGIYLQEYCFLTTFFHKYACNKSGIKIPAEFSLDIENDYYSPSNNKIVYLVNSLKYNDYPSSWIAFIPIHEVRHALQEQFFKKGLENILEIEPLSIIMFKQRFADPKLYRQNHKNYIIENDANLTATTIITDFFKQYMPSDIENLDKIKNYIEHEKTNYSRMIRDSIPLDMEYDNNNEDNLPYLYDCDKRLKMYTITPDNIEEYPILEFLYTKDGKPKTYKEIISDKLVLLSKFKEKEVSVRNNSISDYKEGNISSYAHIELIYASIIKSDPLLQIEHYLFHNNIDEAKRFLESCPQLVDAYQNGITSLLCQYLTMDNYSKVSSLVTTIGSDAILKKVDNRYNRIVKDDIRSIFGFRIDGYVTSDGEEFVVKDMQTLNLEENTIYQNLEKRIEDGSLSESMGREYQRVVHGIYDGYRIESVEDINKNASINESIKK